MYSIGQAAELAGFSIDTLRYYEKLGLTKPPQRGPGGMRSYSEEDVRTLTSLHCLKNTGMSLEEIKSFMQGGQCFANPAFPLSADAWESILSRAQILSQHLAKMEAQQAALSSVIRQTREKLDFYNGILEKEALKK